MTDHRLQKVLDTFGAQLGEIAWYDSTFDTRIDEVTHAQSGEMREVIRRHLGDREPRTLRLLEVGAYGHYSMHLLGDEFDCTAAATDISASSLRRGAASAREKGLKARATLAACDFHDLPFATGYFDFVHIASAVHHTWRTERVLEELLRVTAPGGVLMLANEPIKRELCFYQFRSNRPEDLTAWEQKVHDAGLLYTISSPFLGSRDEEIFGMIENDRIPWDTFEDFLDGVEVLEKHLTPVEGAYEQEILAGTQTAGELASAFESRLQPLRAAIDDTARTLGFSLPDAGQVSALFESVGPLIRRARERKGEAGMIARSRLFGAALRTVVRKPHTVPRAAGMWRRTPPLQEGVHVEQPKLDDMQVQIEKIELPRMAEEHREQIQRIFAPTAWKFFQEDSGIWGVLMHTHEESFTLPASNDEGVLLLRFYAVAKPDQRYRISIFVDGEEQASLDIVRSESRMVPLIVPPRPSTVTLRATMADGSTPTAFAYHIRVAVCRRVPFRMAA